MGLVEFLPLEVLMKTDLRRRVSAFLGCDAEYKNSYIVLEDGGVLGFDGVEPSVTEGECELSLSAELGEYYLSVRFVRDGDGVIASASAESRGGEKRIREIVSAVISLECDERSGIFFKTPERRLVGGFTELSKKTVSEDVCSFYSKDCPERSLTFFHIIPAKFHSELVIERELWSAVVSLHTVIPLSYCGEIFAERVIISGGHRPEDRICELTERFRYEGELPSPIGWSTWDYYFTSADENDVRENVDAIVADERLRKRVRYIALDDGWQQREGDWREGIRYPSGLGSLVSYIRERGLEAGIWIAPTRLHYLSGTVMRRNAFLVRNAIGDPIMDVDMYVLDPTHPDGEKYLRETFSYLASCGFTFYKLDFISNMLKCDYFYDKNAGPYDALRRLVEIVRECVPKGSHVMGCSMPYAIGGGVVDSRRTGLDIHNTWGHLKMCTYLFLGQFASGGTVFRSDLDYLVVRGPETSDDETTNVLNPSLNKNLANPTKDFRWRDGKDFSYEEAKTWCSVILMSGSSIFFGDNIPLLSERGLELLRRTVENADFVAAKPHLPAEALPEIWYKSEGGKLYIYNFSDEEKSYSVDTGALIGNCDTLVDLFSDKSYKTDGGKLSVTLAPHCCLTLVKR